MAVSARHVRFVVDEHIQLTVTAQPQPFMSGTREGQER